MRILGPLVCSTTSPSTDTLASLAASVVTSSPSTTSSAGNESSAPGSPSSFSTSTMSPTATLYCLPPVLTIAYIGTELSCYSVLETEGCACGQRRARVGPPKGGPTYRVRGRLIGGQTRGRRPGGPATGVGPAGAAGQPGAARGGGPPGRPGRAGPPPAAPPAVAASSRRPRSRTPA